MSEKSIFVSNYFKCPDCKGVVLTEIQTDIVLSSVITDLHDVDTFIEAEYSLTAWDGGAKSHYQCQKCGYIIRRDEPKPVGEPIDNLEDLLEWLIAHKAERGR